MLKETEANISALSPPASASTRYVHFANQVKNVGFNNALNEVILLAHLAHASDRVYVFRPMLLQRRPTLPSQTFIAGPAGGEDAMAVSLARWNEACPLRERTYYGSTQVRLSMGLNGDSDAAEHMDRWTTFLRNLPDRCVEILKGTPLVFDYDVIVSPKIVSLWATISVSPVVTRFAWSPLVHRGLARTLPRLDVSSHASDATIPRLVAIHVRRGDFSDHCAFLSGWSPIYTSWNLLPTLPDGYTAPYPQDHDDFMRRCYPTPQQIVLRLRSLRAERGSGLEKVYVATNGKGEFLKELRRVLRDDGWKDVLTSRDLELPADERIVDQGIDMEIATRAELFVGNGFSSLTATITMLRLTRGKDASTIRFW
ncbi:hypothetical protein EXIGLDRAFT_625252 [Exidia glandulosa HHB12029]|uniref:Uncharacterized protein n=2 Tax=Exidia glandulosa HHB12029 TaxID=1314781 RepID=A0A165D3T2_EXIGL|nr:hypothetical protein EXIGLDRAFT_625252 [Exidia glandulosa HHB12029]